MFLDSGIYARSCGRVTMVFRNDMALTASSAANSFYTRHKKN
ncbi:hypothetical protein SXCC_00409 [Gluconacetobacter sp. SXCC-1]|nr:hypothetical protein SXCC_00409 [Gluconacetobacter sp. SXCC-1]